MKRIQAIRLTIIVLLFASTIQPPLQAKDTLRASMHHPERVYVGTYLKDISGFDTKEGRFEADLHLWVKWYGTEKVPPVEISNAEISYMDTVAKESDHDWHSVRLRIQGTFRGSFPLIDFPFDKQTIDIEIELPTEWGELIPDQAGSGMAEQFSITGWVYEPYFKSTKESKTFASDFGSIESEGERQTINTVTYSLELDRPFTANFIKLIVPLVIILLMASLAFFVSNQHLVVRNGMVTTALLTCVAFHFSQSESLPDVAYLVAADKFFLCSYSLIIYALIGVVVSYRFHLKNHDRSKNADRFFSISLPILALIAGCSISFNHERQDLEIIADARPDRPEIQSQRDTLHKAVPILPDLFESRNQPLYMRGLYYVGEDGHKIPHLAVKVPHMANDCIRLLADGGIAVRWQLRKNLKWGDGTPITVDDLIFSLGCITDPNRREIKKVDELSIQVVYNKRLNNVTDAFQVYPKNKLKDVFEIGGIDSVLYIIAHNPPPMDGPYILQEFIREKYALFSKNPYFAGNEPRIEHVRIGVNKDGERWLAPKEIFEKRKADLISLMSKGSFKSVSDVAHVKQRIDSLSNDIFFLQPDITVSPFNNINIRKAISYAIDRKRIVEAVDDGAGEELISSYHSQFEDLNYSYDPEKARSLIENSKLESIPTIKLIGYSRGPGAPEHTIQEIIKENLEVVGFSVNFQPVAEQKTELLQTGDHGSLLYYQGTRDDMGMFWNVPYNTVENRYEMHQVNGLFDEDVLAIYRKYEASLFEERRASLSKKIDRLYARYLPTIPIFSISYRSTYDKSLRGWNPMAADQQNVWWNVEDWYFRE